MRAIWHPVWVIFFRPTPRIFHAWRCFLLLIFGAKIGKKVHIYPSAKIWAPWNLEMGDYSCLSEDVDCYCVAKIKIGAHTVISQYSFLCSASHNYYTKEMNLIVAPIIVGEWVWITADVYIAPGVSIGDGAVVTARSSVFHNLPPWMVASGNPAIPFKNRRLEKFL